MIELAIHIVVIAKLFHKVLLANPSISSFRNTTFSQANRPFKLGNDRPNLHLEIP
jgi:hypothetical protein